MEKQISNHAAVAKLIRQFMKAEGMNGRVTSDSYAGGNSVHVSVEDMAPEQKAKLEAHANQYQYGHFDGMTDCYEYSNSRKDIPQVKFVFVENRPSAEMRQKIWDFAVGYFNGMEGAPSDAAEACHFRNENWQQYGDQMIWMLFNGAYKEFWQHQAQQKAA